MAVDLALDADGPAGVIRTALHSHRRPLTEPAGTAEDSHVALSSADEQQALAQVVERIVARYPFVGRPTVSAAVLDRAAAYAGAPIRDFVPMLIERDVSEAFARRRTAQPA